MPMFEGLLPGLIINQNPVFADNRGIFYEKYNKYFLAKNKLNFIQENISLSFKGVIRGLHWQSNKKAQDKLITCIFGNIVDIAVDLRVSSPTFGYYTLVELHEGQNKSLFIPKGFAHGFQALSEKCIISYSVSEEYSFENSHTINPLCPALNIHWPDSNWILSKNDSEALNFNDQDRSKFFE